MAPKKAAKAPSKSEIDKKKKVIKLTICTRLSPSIHSGQSLKGKISADAALDQG